MHLHCHVGLPVNERTSSSLISADLASVTQPSSLAMALSLVQQRGLVPVRSKVSAYCSCDSPSAAGIQVV